MEIKEMIEVLTAFEEGKEIQFCKGEEWLDILNRGFTGFNFYAEEYRIKPQPTYIPFEFKDYGSLIGEIVRTKDDESRSCIIVSINQKGIELLHNSFSYKEALESLVFIDGTPFGKLQ